MKELPRQKVVSGAAQLNGCLMEQSHHSADGARSDCPDYKLYCLGGELLVPCTAQYNGKAAAEALANQTLKSLQVIWKEDIRRWHPGQDWSLSEGGFGIFDPGINAFSILTRVLSAPVFISAAKLFFPSNRQAPIAADITFSTSSAPNGELKGTFDWRQHGPPTWEIMIETLEGVALKLADGGRKLEIAGQPPLEAGTDEYPDIYREFGELVEAGRSKVEVAPFQLVADAFMIGRRTAVEAFNF